MTNTETKEIQQSGSELYFPWIINIKFRSRLSDLVHKARERRKLSETQKQVSDTLEIPLTKIKQVENGSCKDINSIVAYINYQFLEV